MNDLTGNNGFTEQDFLEYIEMFNHNDFDGFAEYYADNIIFEGRSRHFRNRVEVVSFYRKLKSLIRETVTVKEMLIGKNEIAVEIETELYAFEDWLDMPTGPMHKGEIIRSRNFVWYEIQNRKFVHIRSAHYRRIGSSEGSSGPHLHTMRLQAVSGERFTGHVGVFDLNNCAFLGGCLHEDVALGIGGKRGLKGREAVLNFCEIVKMQTQGTVEIKRIIDSGNLLAAELLFKLVALNNLPDFITGPMKKNGRIFINVFALCHLHNGRFTRIRFAKFSKTECP